MAGPSIIVRFLADTKELSKGIDQVDQQGGGKLKSFGAKAAGAIGGAFAIGSVVAFGKAAVGAAAESQKATAGLENVFRQMGDTTGKAADAALKYADALSTQIGVEDELIIAAQTKLATFGAVSDETARQAGIFDRATVAAADLAAAGFGSMDTNAVQLGKALQDPVKGLAALGKSGVTFTEGQKAQIAAMVESGDLLGAQKIVLGAIEKQVGGTAAATATSGEKMKVAFGKVQEKVGKALLPVLEKLAPIIGKIAGFIERNSSVILPLVAVIGVLVVAWNIASIASTLFAVSMAAALWPVLLVIAAIAALVAIGYVIVRNWQTIKDMAAVAFDFILGIVKTVWNWIADNWPLLLIILGGPIGAAVVLIVKHWDTIWSAIKVVFAWFVDVWSTIYDVLSAPIKLAVDFIVSHWDQIKAAALTVWDWFVGTWPFLKSLLVDPFVLAKDLIVGAFNGMKDGAVAVYNFVVDKFRALQDFFRGVADTVKGAADSIAGAVRGPLNAVIRAWNRLEFTVPEVNVGPIHFGGQSIGMPNIPELASGGIVRGPTLALIGERGPEAVVPLGAGGLGGSSYSIVVNVAPGTDPSQTGRAIVDAIQAYERTSGRAWRAS